MSTLDGGSLSADELLVEHVAFSGRTPALGRIIDVGAERASERDRFVGKLAVLPALRACTACVPCRRGHAALCLRPGATPTFSPRGAIAARVAVVLEPSGTPPAPGLLVEPDDAWRLACLATLGLHAYAALIRASVEPNRAAIVVGEGDLARFVGALVRHRGAVPLSGTRAEVDAALASHGIEPFGIPVIATDGNPYALATAGSIVVRCVPGDVTGPLPRELTIIDVAAAHPDLLPELVAFVAAGTLDLSPLCARVAEPSDALTSIWCP